MSYILASNIFVHYISKYLFPEHINNCFYSCKEIQKNIDDNWKFIYEKICLHIQPNGHCFCSNNQRWYKEGKLHRDGDLPAAIWPNGRQQWYKNGEIHREGDKPAVIYAVGSLFVNVDNDIEYIERSFLGYNEDCTQKWYKFGKLHREEDKPAVIWANGIREWYEEGKRHRAGNRPAMININFVSYYQDGLPIIPN